MKCTFVSLILLFCQDFCPVISIQYIIFLNWHKTDHVQSLNNPTFDFVHARAALRSLKVTFTASMY